MSIDLCMCAYPPPKKHLRDHYHHHPSPPTNLSNPPKHTNSPGPSWLAAFLQASAPHLPTFTAPELTSLINSFANLRFLPPAPYYAAVSAGIRQRLPEMRPWELGMAVNGFGRAAAVASSSSGGGSKGEISGGIDSGGLGGRYTVVDDETGGAFHPGFDLVRALEEAALPRLDEFDPQGLAGLVNGFGHLGHQPSKAFLDAFISCVARRMPRFNSQVGCLGWDPVHDTQRD